LEGGESSTLFTAKSVPVGSLFAEVVAFAAACEANSRPRRLFLLHVHIFFASVRLGLGLLVAALLRLVAPASAGLAR
jgi:hypothetical protein